MHANLKTITATASEPARLILIESPRALSPDEFRAIRAAGFAWQPDARAFVAPWTVEAFAAAARLAGRVDVEGAGGQWQQVDPGEAGEVMASGEDKPADIDSRPAAGLRPRKNTDWPFAVDGWTCALGGKEAPGYASEQSARIALSKAPELKARDATILPFHYWDGSIMGKYKDLSTRYVILIRRAVENEAAQASGESETIAAPHDFPRPGWAERFASIEAIKTPPTSGEAKTAAAEFAKLSDFVGRSQLAAIRDAMHGEEGAHFVDLIMDLAQRIAAMPQTYQQDGMGDAAVVNLHYFNAGSDWYITEKDADGGTAQAFGYAVLNGMEDCAELGYISIADLVAHGVELDLHWQPRTLGEVKAERAGGDGGPDGPGAGMPSGEAGDVPTSGEQAAPTGSGEDEARGALQASGEEKAGRPTVQTVARTIDGETVHFLAAVPAWAKKRGESTLYELDYGALGVAEARAAKLRAAGIAAKVWGRWPYSIAIDPSGEVVADACPTLIPGRWIPGGAENAERIAFDAALGAEVWLMPSTTRPGQHAAIAYSGKRSKHDAYYTMRDRTQALEWAGAYMGKQQAKSQRKSDQRAEQAAKRAAGHKLQAGDVLRCSWGYDQTNIDYYEVTRLIGRRMVEIRKIGAESIDSGNMTGECVPRPGHYIGEPMRKAVSDYDGQSVRIYSFANAYKIEPREVAGVKVYPVDHWTAYA